MAERRARKPRDLPTATAGSVDAPLATSLRGRVPSLSPLHAESLRGFLSERRRWPLRDGGLLHVRVLPRAGAGEAFAVDADGVRLALRFEGGPSGADDGLRWSDHVGRSRVLAWSLEHEARLVRLGEALGVALVPQLTELVADAEDDVWLQFDVDDEPRDGDDGGTVPAPTRGTMRVPGSWLPRLTEIAEPRYEDEPLPPLGVLRALPAAVAIMLSIPALSARDWRALRPGDVIVVGRSGRPPAFQARAAGRAWPLAQAVDGWRVEGAAQNIPANNSQENHKMSETEAESGTAQDPARALPVRVEFELGALELSVGELADLQPGYVFALPAHLEGANVVIRANGRAAGRGEVVAIGETLGVRLLSWS